MRSRPPRRRGGGRLRAESEEFAAPWKAHGTGVRREGDRRRIQHPDFGVLELQCQVLHDANQAQALLLCTATPGSKSHDKLQLLSVVGGRSSQR
ncbi:hypothetical protein [Streptomyces sp. NBC_01285]|uniref:MmyB family transcriptional regulator n=1 Tax=Streptomyces sp. NBC_01285 TaxID=2903813 RepID=UPI0022544D4D|nr:hypothetical protein [Streptomyces sp. NBC_01285]MCX4774797.1 hypothetical protein [Streptomyces sp. NBC_01285]